MTGKPLIYILLLIVFSSIAFASSGICFLDKTEYHPGENAVLSCGCTLGSEKNQPGYIVFMNSSGDVLQSTATNSNDCQLSLFGAQYTFLVGQNFSGNATFALNANGTEFPINWDGVGDIPSDDFNVTGAHTTDCIISFSPGVAASEDPILGTLATLQATITDGVTGYTLTHANCHLHIIGVDGVPLVHEPYTPPGDVSVETGAFGEIILQYMLTEDFWEINTNYIAEINCYCTINGTVEQCYLGGDGVGAIANFKECQSEIIVTSGSEDKRDPGNEMLSITITALIMILLYFGLGYLNYRYKLANFDSNSHYVYLLCFVLAIIQSILLLSFIYGDSIYLDLSGLLKINFYVNFILMGFILIATLIITMATIFASKEEVFDDKKWQDR